MYSSRGSLGESRHASRLPHVCLGPGLALQASAGCQSLCSQWHCFPPFAPQLSPSHGLRLVTCGCSNKAPQTGGLHQQELLSWFRRPESEIKVSAGPRLGRLSDRILSASCSFWWPQASLACACITAVSASLFTQPSPLCVSSSVFWTCVIGFSTRGDNPG